MRTDFNGWWLLPFGILAASMLIALGIVVFQPPFVERSFAQRAPSEVAADCSGALSNDYACYQKRYQDLVRGSGVATAFAELKDEYEKNEYVKTNCHQLTHVIGRGAVGLYGDLSSTYSRGDPFCQSGYYHGAIETVVAEIGPDKILEEADTICADLGEREKYSSNHYNCVHGLGHGFMGILENELFESLKTCDTLTGEWEKESCYGGVFMENVMAEGNPSHPPKYLKADQPLYPCTEVEDKYKPECYKRQTWYALYTQGNDFGRAFELCGEVEDDSQPMCYEGLGREASWRSDGDVTKTKDTCMLSEDREARSNCVIGVIEGFVSYYDSDRAKAQAKELCESLDADLREVCSRTSEEYLKNV